MIDYSIRLSLDEVVKNSKDEKVILVCLTGERSLRAVQFLNEYGFTNLLNMKKGLSKWAQKGYPIKGVAIIEEKSCCGGHSHCN